MKITLSSRTEKENHFWSAHFLRILLKCATCIQLETFYLGPSWQIREWDSTFAQPSTCYTKVQQFLLDSSRDPITAITEFHCRRPSPVMDQNVSQVNPISTGVLWTLLVEKGLIKTTTTTAEDWFVTIVPHCKKITFPDWHIRHFGTSSVRIGAFQRGKVNNLSIS